MGDIGFWTMVGHVLSTNDRDGFKARSMDEAFEDRWSYYLNRGDGAHCQGMTKKEAHNAFVDGWLDERENTARSVTERGPTQYRFDRNKFSAAVKGYVGDQSLTTAAAAIGVSWPFLANIIERDTGVRPSFEGFLKLCNAMQISPGEFFNGKKLFAGGTNERGLWLE